MSAMEKGYTRGREYLRRCQIEKLTFTEYKQLGNVDVKQQYKQKKAQDQYLLGWWHAGEQFATLFKTDDNDTYSALKRVKTIQQRLEGIADQIDELHNCREDDETLQDALWEAYEALDSALKYLGRASDHLSKE